MSAPTISTEIRTSTSGSTPSGMTSEEIHTLLSLPFASTSQMHPTYRGPSDNFPAGPSQSGVLDFLYPSDLLPRPRPLRQDTPFVGSHPNPDLIASGSEQPHLPDHASQSEGVFSTLENQDIGTPYANNSPDLPKYTDLDTNFTKEEYTAIAICYDIYGLSSSKIVAADPIFETRKAVVLDLFWRFLAYDVLQSMKSLEQPPEFYQPHESVSFHYSTTTWLSSSQDCWNSLEPPLVTFFAIGFKTRLEEGDLAARLLQANETSLSRRGKYNQGLGKWERSDEERFNKRHGVPSPLKSMLSDSIAVENLFQELERRNREKRKKSPTSSSSSYETKSGYHSRSSSFSSGSHIPGSVRGNTEFPFGYPISIWDNFVQDTRVITAPASVNHSEGSALSSPSPSPGFTHPKADKSTTHAIASPVQISKPFRCPTPYCNKSYKQANGLKYHLTHGSCNRPPPNSIPLLAPAGFSNILESDPIEVEFEAERKLKPFACGVGECPRRYRNMKGLRYHYQYSHCLGNKEP